MSNTKHTAAPWKFQVATAAGAYVLTAGDEWILSATVPRHEAPSAIARMNADFDLIEAAPELLAVMREIVNGSNASIAPILAALRRASPGLLRDARAAIAKATGAQP